MNRRWCFFFVNWPPVFRSVDQLTQKGRSCLNQNGPGCIDEDELDGDGDEDGDCDRDHDDENDRDGPAILRASPQ